MIPPFTFGALAYAKHKYYPARITLKCCQWNGRTQYLSRYEYGFLNLLVGERLQLLHFCFEGHVHVLYNLERGRNRFHITGCGQEVPAMTFSTAPI